MQIQILGPVQIRVDDAVVDVGPPQRCLVFAALAADAGGLVPLETLIERVWGQAPPRGAGRTVQTHIANLRGLLRPAGAPSRAPVVLVRRRGGYVLELEADRVDIHRFRRLVTQAVNTRLAAAERMALWREAVGLWRGAPLAALAGDWAVRTRDAWHAEYRDAVLGWAYAEIEAGNPTAAISSLADLIVRYPLIEALPAMLMRALYAAGRRPEALHCYVTAKQRLDDELAEKPGAELKAVYQAILRHDRTLPPPTGTVPADIVMPAQLPPDVRGFAGRADQLAYLDRVADTLGEDGTAVVISAIAGTAGVGKTALAVHWAHKAAERFPDGQLYVNLRGYDPDGSAMDPAEAIRGFLSALAIPPERIPADRDARTALYRTLMARKRMLVVLDNARGAEQVRPLLPGAPSCLVLVTSRNQLTSLVASTGAYPVPLDLLTVDEARDLLTRRLGAHRVTAELDAVDELITGCARLPLALAIVAARAAGQPLLSLATLAADLRDGHSRLDALADSDPAGDVRAVFSWSYAILTPPAARLFRLLGLHPGPDTSPAAAASLAGLPPTVVRPLLDELTRAHLVVEHRPGRYTFHDLLRAYAVDLVHQTDPATERRAATHRMLDHYLHTADAASTLIFPTRDPASLAPARTGTVPEHISDCRQAVEWFNAECSVLPAVVNQAAATGHDTHTWQLVWNIHDALDRRGLWHDLAAVNHAAVAAATRLADPTAHAFAHRGLARAYILLGHDQDAQVHLRHALFWFDRAGHALGRAHVHHTFAVLWERLGRPVDALHHGQQALDLYRAADYKRGLANALNTVGWLQAQLGDDGKALTYCRQALALQQELASATGPAATWDSLGYIHHRIGQHTEAATCYQHAVDLYRSRGDHYNAAESLTSLGDTHRSAGDHTAARAAWQRALTVLDRIHDHPDADQLRVRLRGVDRLAG